MILYLNSYKDPAQATWTKADYLLAAAKHLKIGDSVLKYSPEIKDAEYVLNIEPFQNFAMGKKWTSVWEIDVMFDRPQLSMSDWVVCDIVFVANSTLPKRMEAFQGEKIVLFQACDPELHRRVPDVKQKYDFVFAGSNNMGIYDERARTMTLLRDKGFTFFDHGKGHSPQKYVRKINEARVQFVRSAGKEGVANNQVAQRFFECLAIGPVLKDYHPDLKVLGLEEGEDFFWYKNDKEMLEKMEYLIKNPDFAKKMAINGRRKALLYHTYSHRLISILNFIKEHVGYQ